MAYTITKKGKKPENKPMRGITISDSFPENAKFEKYKIEITRTKIILGIKEDIVNPYNEDMSNCFFLGSISSSLTFNIKIAVIKPTVKNQKTILITIFKIVEVISCVKDCSQ